MALIAILDDRVTNRNIYTRLAAAIEPGVTVRAFGDPVEALAWIDEAIPDLVITDYKMPGLDGAEFIRRFRDRPGCAEVPVVVVTVYEDRSFRLRALEAGATDFLQSPVDHAEFLTRARNLLKLRKQQKLLEGRAHILERELIDSERSREAALRDSREHLAQVIDTVPAMISAADRNGRCVFVNEYQAKLCSLDPIDIVGRNAAEIFGRDYAERSRSLDEMVFSTGKALPTFEEAIVDAGGVRRNFLTTKAPLRDASGATLHVLTTALDITDRRRAEDHLLHLAHHDALTDLPNRVLLRDRIRREMARARRGDRSCALHLIDLDHFKTLNDALGHDLGDRLIRCIAQRLRACAGEGDTVARLGSDEFAILQTGLGEPSQADALAQRVVEALARPFSVDGEQANTGASIGIAFHPTDSADSDDLFRKADLALRRAKNEGRGGWRRYQADMHDTAERNAELDAALRLGLSRGEFVLHYQPQIDLRTGRIVGAEALLRWNCPGFGLVRPADFLPLAEENGLIVPINEWVLREACRQAVAWTAAGLPALRIAVNLSPVQFRQQDVGALVMDVLQESGLDPARLDLELTENIVMRNADAAARDLARLRAHGVTFSIDDFGTGYSSLSYLKRFPVDRLKIDQCFVRTLHTDPNDAAIVQAVIDLGHNLDLRVVAEGVELPQHAAFLEARGCDEAQGYHFGRPMPADTFAQHVRRRLVEAVPALAAGFAR